MKTQKPADWEKGLSVKDGWRGTFQIDDADKNFSSYPAADMTAFFRKPEIVALEAVAKKLAQIGGDRKLLSLPASVGCEGYSLAAIFKAQAAPNTALEIDLSDISEKKLKAAQSGIYPAAFAQSIPDAYKEFFQTDGERIELRPDIKAMASTLPAMNILDMNMPDNSYDAILSLNFFYYLKSRENKIKAAQKLAKASRNILCISHGIKKSYEHDGAALSEAILNEGFREDTTFYAPYNAYHAQVFVKEPS